MINNFLNLWKKNNRLTYVLNKESKYKIKTRYELLHKDKIKNLFLYFDSWEQFKKIYDKIPNEYKHFYEIMEDECKFFVDLDAKKDEINEKEWYNFINEIKYMLKKIFYNLFFEDIKFVEYESFGNKEEEKYSCHIIVENFRFSIFECKLLCELLIKDIDSEYKSIIDPNVYGKWRSLRIENSTKVESKRIKLLRHPNKEFNSIYINGLITNLDNTISVKNIFKNVSIENEYILNYTIKKEIRQINYLDTNFISKKYIVDENDVKLIKERYMEIEYLINKWNHDTFNSNFKENKIFYTKKIIQNMILYKRIIPFNCPICKRIHEKQDSYIYIKNKKLYFHCRRTNLKPVIFASFDNCVNNFKISF